MRRALSVVVYVAAVAALVVQLVVAIPAQPSTRSAESLIDVSPALNDNTGVTEPKVIWRTFRPGQYGSLAPTGWICGAALQRGEQQAALIVRLCTEHPLSPQRRFTLGFDSFVLDAQLPGGYHLSYSLVNYVRTGPWSARDFAEGPTLENDVPVRQVFVRDTTDIVVELGLDVPVGLPTVSVQGSYLGAEFVDSEPFFELGPAVDTAAVELRHSADAPVWARLRP